MPSRCAITAYSLCSAAGDGQVATLARCASGAAACTRNDFGPSAARLPGSGGSPALEDRSRLPPHLADWDCRNNRLAWHGLPQTDSSTRLQRLASATARARVAVVLGTSTSSIGASEDAYRAARAGRAVSCRPAPPDRAHAALARRFRAARARAERTERHGRDRVLVERQGVRAGRAADAPRARRRGRGRRRRHAVRQRAVRLQFAGAGLGRAVPAVRSRAPRHQPRRGGGIRAARARSGRRPRGCSATASRAMRITCRSPHPEGRGARLAMQRCA